MKRHLQATLFTAPLFLASYSHQAVAGPFFAGIDTAATFSFSNEALLKNANVTSQTTTIIGVRTYLGYQFTPNISVEFGLTNRSNYMQEGSTRIVSYRADVKATNKDILLAYHLTDVLPGLFALGGMTWTKYEAESTAKVLNQEVRLSGSENHRQYTIGLGYERPITDNLHWRAAFARYGKDKMAVFGLKYLFNAQ